MVDGIAITLLIFGSIFAALSVGGAFADYLISLFPPLKNWIEQRSLELEEEQKWAKQDALMKERR